MTHFRLVPCPACRGAGISVRTTHFGRVARGCHICSDSALTIGTGRIRVTFERSAEVDAALTARSGKEIHAVH